MCVNEEEEEEVKERVINAFNKRSSNKRNGEVERVQIPTHHYKMIGRFHNSVVGHKGIDTTIKMMEENDHKWKNMKQHIEAFVKRCPIYQKSSDTKNNNT